MEVLTETLTQATRKEWLETARKRKYSGKKRWMQRKKTLRREEVSL
jgi:hypothetical protein